MEEERGAGGEVRTELDADAGEEARAEGLAPQEIDAYWLQRRISRAFGAIDADASQALAEKVLATLQVWPPSSLCTSTVANHIYVIPSM